MLFSIHTEEFTRSLASPKLPKKWRVQTSHSPQACKLHAILKSVESRLPRRPRVHAKLVIKRTSNFILSRTNKSNILRCRSSAKEVSLPDVIVIGSGIGGLSSAALLARYGIQVLVCESHSIPGGSAHSWKQQGYHFESGPSLYSGLASRGQGANPLAHVLQAVDERLELLPYNTWNCILPEGKYITKVGGHQFETVIKAISPSGLADWKALKEVMKPLSNAATMVPPAAIRSDPAVFATAFIRFLPSLLKGGPAAAKLIGPFSKVLQGTVKDQFIRNWLDLLCFLLSEWYREGSCLEFPKGGSQSIINALVRGLKKYNGEIRLNAHVEEILVERGRAVGVKLKNGEEIFASKAVISNASLKDTLKLLPPELPAARGLQVRAKVRTADGTVGHKNSTLAFTRPSGSLQETPLNRSFMHLHLGFDGEGLPADLQLHHIVVNSWEEGVDSEQNVVLISIPSVADSSMAPPGHHCLHAYLPATEPFSRWEGLERGSLEYEQLKKERSQVLWDAVERVIPDIRSRAVVEMVGTPLTHQHFLRREAGSYGPGIKAGEGTFPGPLTGLPGLLCCGDSTFPGIGVPAVAASGMIAANSLVPFWDHWKLLNDLGL